MRNFTRRKSSGFTLVELLVVVAVIVVLLALLMPAMDQAVYQAELAVCSGRLKAGANGVLQYAMDNKRYYPHRKIVFEETLQSGPSLIANRFNDDRDVVFKALGPQYLLDPFCPKINLQTTVPDNYVATHYAMWFGWKYLKSSQQGMIKLGNRFHFAGRGYNLLLTDADGIVGDETTAEDKKWESSTHPDRLNVMFKQGPFQDAVNPWPFWNLHGAYATWSTWTSQNVNKRRGPIDTNYAYDDGSVRRMDNVVRGDERMEFVATHQLAPADEPVTSGGQLPR